MHSSGRPAGCVTWLTRLKIRVINKTILKCYIIILLVVIYNLTFLHDTYLLYYDNVLMIMFLINDILLFS